MTEPITNAAIGKRTKLDFSNHEVLVTKTDEILIHHLKIPGTRMDSIKFINTNGIMAVTGDYSNWMFCREFHPSARYDSGVSDEYWLEKLEIHSCQRPYRFDPEGTASQIKELLADKDEPPTEEEKEYLETCLSNVYDEVNYNYEAFRNNVGRYEDHEYIPFVEKLHVQLPYVFDGFDEICRRLKEQETAQ